jgi:hypothetical protein
MYRMTWRFNHLSFEEIAVAWAKEGPRSYEKIFDYLLRGFWAGEFGETDATGAPFVMLAGAPVKRAEILATFLGDFDLFGDKDGVLAHTLAGTDFFEGTAVDLTALQIELGLASNPLSIDSNSARIAAYERLSATETTHLPEYARNTMKELELEVVRFKAWIVSRGHHIPAFLAKIHGDIRSQNSVGETQNENEVRSRGRGRPSKYKGYILNELKHRYSNDEKINFVPDEARALLEWLKNSHDPHKKDLPELKTIRNIIYELRRQTGSSDPK